MGASSRRETRLEGETSSSEMSSEEWGEYIWMEEGWDEGRIRWDVDGWMARGMGESSSEADACGRDAGRKRIN